MVGISPRPWVGDASGCGWIAGAIMCGRGVEVPCWGSKRNGSGVRIGEDADLEFVVPLSVVDPEDFCEGVGLDDNVVPDDEFDGDGSDLLIDGWVRIGSGAGAKVVSAKPISGELVS